MKFTISIPLESCTNAKAKYSSSVMPPDPSIHFYHCVQRISVAYEQAHELYPYTLLFTAAADFAWPTRVQNLKSLANKENWSLHRREDLLNLQCNTVTTTLKVETKMYGKICPSQGNQVGKPLLT